MSLFLEAEFNCLDDKKGFTEIERKCNLLKAKEYNYFLYY